MGKRGGENSQLSKEEYEALENQTSSAGTFSVASSETLSKRRIIKTSSKWKQAKSSSGDNGGKKTGAFANFSFGKSVSSTPSAPTGKPAFAMPTLPTPNPSTMAASGTASTAAKFSFAPQSTTSSSKSQNGEVSKLVSGFKSYIQKCDLRVTYTLPVTRFQTTFIKLTRDDNQSASSTSSSSASLGGGSSTGTATAPSKPLFPSVPAAAPAPVPFETFGASSSSGSSFSFGATKSPSSSTTSASTRFSFTSSAPAPTASTTTFSFTSTPAAAPAPTPSGGVDGGGEDAGEKEEPTVLGEGADDDWNTVHKTKVNVFHYREKAPKKFGSGELKLQENKQDGKNRRMVLRNATGKVTLNLKIAKGMQFQKKVTKVPGKSDNCRVVFYGCQDASRGAEMFTVQCRSDALDAFHAKLEEMAKD